MSDGADRVVPSGSTTRLRKQLAGAGPVVAPGVYDALTARVVDRAGFQAAFVSGAAVSASLLAAPDLGLLTMTELLTQTRNIVSATRLPIIADCDTGYGNALNVRRTVADFEAAGVAGLFIEDQAWPKRCGHFSNKELVSTATMVQKLRAALEARSDPDLVLIARTDAIAVEGLTGALRRAEAYANAGVDLIFAEAPRSIDELEVLARSSALPLMINLVEGGHTPLLSVSDLGAIGVKVITFSGTLQKAAIHAYEATLQHLRATGNIASLYPASVVSLDHRSEILGLADLESLARRYAED